jgi:hypothetical protein
MPKVKDLTIEPRSQPFILSASSASGWPKSDKPVAHISRRFGLEGKRRHTLTDCNRIVDGSGAWRALTYEQLIDNYKPCPRCGDETTWRTAMAEQAARAKESKAQREADIADTLARGELNATWRAVGAGIVADARALAEQGAWVWMHTGTGEELVNGRAVVVNMPLKTVLELLGLDKDPPDPYA